MEDFRLDGKKALVTGASRGLGRGIALALARAGADVAVAARSAGPLEETATEIRRSGRQSLSVVVDFAEESAPDQVCRRFTGDWSGVDIVVHAAGIQLRKPAVEVTRVEWDRVLAVNLAAPYFLSCRMRSAHSCSRHIFVASLTSSIGIANIAPYGVSKSGILGVVRALAVEWAESGITVNAVQPGYFHTELTEAVFNDPARRVWVESRIPLGRAGTVQDLSGTVVFLASPAASYVTGQCLAVDGGWLAS